MSTPADLVEFLKGAGLNVVEYDGWSTRGGSWSGGHPAGLMIHHTAPPVPYPVANLAGVADGRIKCNVNIKPDGSVVLVAYRACNYSSGQGSSVVLAAARAGNPPSANAAARGLHDDMGLNSYYVNIEVDHWGDGRPIPDVQHDALAIAARVTAAHYDLSAYNTVSHAESTARKVDPFWAGNPRAIEAVRDAMNDNDIDPPPDPPDQPPNKGYLVQVQRDDVHKGDRGDLVGIAQSLLAQKGHPPANTFDDNHVPDAIAGSGFDTAARAYQSAAGLSIDGVVGPNTWASLETARN